MRLLLIGSAVTASVTSFSIFQDHKQASQPLSSIRSKRSNDGVFEELRSGDIKRECQEETCSYDEVLEALGDNVQADAWWKAATSKCSEPDSCYPLGTKLCTNLWRKRECTCKSGFTKTNEKDDCSVDVDECQVEGFCANGGSCLNTEGSFECICTEFWDGEKCEVDKDECTAEKDSDGNPVNPCFNDGVCTNKDMGFTCECPSNWTGELCNIDVNECDAEISPCQNGSGCVNTEGSYYCVCNNGWGGQNCDEDFDECQAGLCPAGTTCQMGEMNQFTCVCPERGCNNLNETVYLDDLDNVFVSEIELDVTDYDENQSNENVLTEEITEDFDENVEEDVQDYPSNSNSTYYDDSDSNNYEDDTDSSNQDYEQGMYDGTDTDIREKVGSMASMNQSIGVLPDVYFVLVRPEFNQVDQPSPVPISYTDDYGNDNYDNSTNYEEPVVEYNVDQAVEDYEGDAGYEGQVWVFFFEKNFLKISKKQF